MQKQTNKQKKTAQHDWQIEHYLKKLRGKDFRYGSGKGDGIRTQSPSLNHCPEEGHV